METLACSIPIWNQRITFPLGSCKYGQNEPTVWDSLSFIIYGIILFHSIGSSSSKLVYTLCPRVGSCSISGYPILFTIHIVLIQDCSVQIFLLQLIDIGLNEDPTLLNQKVAVDDRMRYEIEDEEPQQVETTNETNDDDIQTLIDHISEPAPSEQDLQGSFKATYAQIDTNSAAWKKLSIF